MLQCALQCVLQCVAVCVAVCPAVRVAVCAVSVKHMQKNEMSYVTVTNKIIYLSRTHMGHLTVTDESSPYHKSFHMRHFTDSMSQ